MNKAELISAIGNGAGISKAEAGECARLLHQGDREGPEKGDKVTLVGFGTFSVGKRNARTGRNPKTGKPIKIAAKKVAKFKPGKGLADKVK